ncbi:sulfurtransferase TusA family protein [Cellulomonas sp. 179-A 9B4 NHS]|uniref:sulfurtransferase TusA family protein n=1 Tax=Cellulomonas sp. 179-A 9B4 NHS TaxID=3142379 RepID=UPI00399EFE07
MNDDVRAGAGALGDDGGAARPVEVDARGLRCPAPVLRAAVAARSLPAGTLLRVLATDPAAAVDLPAWARMRGHAVVASDRPGRRPGDDAGGDAGDEVAVTVRLGG